VRGKEKKVREKKKKKSKRRGNRVYPNASGVSTSLQNKISQT